MVCIDKDFLALQHVLTDLLYKICVLMNNEIDNFKPRVRYSIAKPIGREFVLRIDTDAPKKFCPGWMSHEKSASGRDRAYFRVGK